MSLEWIRWSRDSDSALNNMPQTDVLGRAGGYVGIFKQGYVYFSKSA